MIQKNSHKKLLKSSPGSRKGLKSCQDMSLGKQVRCKSKSPIYSITYCSVRISVGGLVVNRVDCRLNDVGSKDKEKASLECMEVALVNVRRTVKNEQTGENLCLFCTYFSICCLKMHLAIKI
jgi:hypothetical protein